MHAKGGGGVSIQLEREGKTRLSCWGPSARVYMCACVCVGGLHACYPCRASADILLVCFSGPAVRPGLWPFQGGRTM